MEAAERPQPQVRHRSTSTGTGDPPLPRPRPHQHTGLRLGVLWGLGPGTAGAVVPAGLAVPIP